MEETDFVLSIPQNQWMLIRKGFWRKACVKIIKQAVVTALEEEWPALIECLLCAKFYAEPFTCIHSHNNSMLGLLFLSRGHPNLARPHTPS